MKKFDVSVVHMDELKIFGLWKKSNDKTISNDIKNLSEEYHSTVSLSEGKVFPYFVLARNYDEESKDFEMFIGSTINKNGLECLLLSAGEYAKITIKPKLGFLWGVSIGEAKRYFYTKWLPESTFEALNMEYEYHTEKSIGKHPTIDIFFAIQRKS